MAHGNERSHVSADQTIQGVARKSGDAELELPPPDTKRWSSRRKAAVIIATRTGVITRAEAYRRYMLSDEEFANWEEAFDRHGIPGLRSASLQNGSRRPLRHRAHNGSTRDRNCSRR
jgi:uncharacterized protein DUF1153